MADQKLIDEVGKYIDKYYEPLVKDNWKDDIEEYRRKSNRKGG